MQEPENIVANWTWKYGNILHESSRDNVLALARGDRTGGLAIYRAATSWRMPGWNCLKRQKYSSAGIRLRMKDSAESVPCGRRQNLNARLGTCTFRALWRRDSSTIEEVWMQTGKGHDPSASVRNADANSPGNWDHAPADGVVIPMTLPITKEKRKGPLGLTARRNERTEVITRKGYQHYPEWWTKCTMLETPLTWNLDKAHSNLSGKGCADAVSLSLKPYWGKPAVRDFRGLVGNGPERIASTGC